MLIYKNQVPPNGPNRGQGIGMWKGGLMLHTCYGLFSKKTISRYNICEVINVKNKIDPKASINKYHFLAIPKWQFGELNHSKKKRRKTAKSENIQKTKCPPFPSHDMSGRLKWTVKTKLAMLQKKTTQSLFVNAAKMSSALKLKAAYVVASVKKNKIKSQVQISIKHMLNFFLVKVDQ